MLVEVIISNVIHTKECVPTKQYKQSKDGETRRCIVSSSGKQMKTLTRKRLNSGLKPGTEALLCVAQEHAGFKS